MGGATVVSTLGVCSRNWRATKCGEVVEITMLIAVPTVTSLCGGCVMVWEASSSLEKQGLSSLEVFAVQRDMNIAVAMSYLHSPGANTVHQDKVLSKLPPEFWSGELRRACPQSWPELHWTFVESAWTSCSSQTDQQPRWLTCDKCWLKNWTPSHSSEWPGWWPAWGGDSRLGTTQILSSATHPTRARVAPFKRGSKQAF